MTVSGVELGTVMSEEVRRSLMELSDSDILCLAEHSPASSFGNLRKIPSNAGRIRIMLTDRIMSSGSDTGIVTILRANSFYTRFTCVLSIRALTEGYESLACAFGDARVLLAMLVDERKEVSDFAKTKIKETPEKNFRNPESPKMAKVSFERMFKPFVSVISNLFSAEDKREELQAAVSNLKKDLDSMRGKAAALDREKEKRKNLESELKRTKTELSGLKADVSAALSDSKKHIAESAALQKALETSQEQIRNSESEIHSAKEQLDQIKYTANALEKKCRELAAGNAALEKARSDLERRLHDCMAATARSEAGSSSPVKEARQLKIARNSGIGFKLRDFFGRIPQPVPNVTSQSKETGSEIPGKKSAGGCGELAEWLDRNMPKGRNSTPLSRFFEIIRTKSSDFVFKASADGFIVLADGHNILLQDRCLRYSNDSKPQKELRNLLADDLEQIAQKCGGMAIRLYFDGVAEHEETRAENFTVVYSGGTGEHRADDRIIGHFAFIRKFYPETPVAVISSDAGILNKCAAGTYAHIRSDDILRFMEKRIW